MVTTDFWKNKRVFITGHTGFKGAWLALWLQCMGAEVVGYALSPPTVPSLFELARVDDDMTTIQGDIRDFEYLLKAVDTHRPEIVFHMAAQSLVRRSYQEPLETYSTNVMGTVHLLEAVRQSGSEVRAIVNVTSDKCYESGQCFGGYSENHPMGGSDPYSSSKGCAELVTAAFRHSFFDSNDFESHGVALASVRAGNVIGGGDWGEHRLVPDIVRTIFDGLPLMIRNPHAIRPWQYVLDPLGGYLLLAEKLYREGPKYAEGWNFGPSDHEAKPVSWIVEQFCRLWGGGFEWEIDDRVHPREAPHIQLDCSKAKLKLGWKPWLSLDQALEWTSTWYRQYQDNPDSVRETTKLQIANYSNVLRT